MSDKHYDALPKRIQLMPILSKFIAYRQQWQVSKDQLPQATYYVDDLHIDQENLDDYRKICGFADWQSAYYLFFCVVANWK